MGIRLFSKFFHKTLDKPDKLCYTNYILITTTTDYKMIHILVQKHDFKPVDESLAHDGVAVSSDERYDDFMEEDLDALMATIKSTRSDVVDVEMMDGNITVSEFDFLANNDTQLVSEFTYLCRDIKITPNTIDSLRRML